MAFRELNFDHLAKFNSATSSYFLDRYEKYVYDEIIAESKEQPHQTFAPSAFRCDRRSWFRLRGVAPDAVNIPDTVLDFSAKIGTACHRILQTNLKNMLGPDWLNVAEYVETLSNGITYDCVEDESGLETLIQTDNPPFRFACDGMIRLDGKVYLLEIKSSEFASWNDLTDPKLQHIDQVNCYCTLLDLDDVIFLYIDRQYGGLKCFEHSVSSKIKSDILSRCYSVLDMVESGLAPQSLPKGDSWCTPHMCPYYKKCGEYGR